MNTSPVLSEMTPNQKRVEAALTKWGYESIWANGKGGGFWVRGRGYMSLENCAELINNHIAEFFAAERQRIVDAIKAVDDAIKTCATPNRYYEQLIKARVGLEAERAALVETPFPRFELVADPQPENKE